MYLCEDAGKTDQYTKADLQYDWSSELHKRLFAHGARDHPGKVFYILVCHVALGHHVRAHKAGWSGCHEYRYGWTRVPHLDTVAGVSPLSLRPCTTARCLPTTWTLARALYREFIV